jgi:hypothetical protein
MVKAKTKIGMSPACVHGHLKRKVEVRKEW